MAVEGKISQKDLDLMLVTDSPEEARDHIVQRYERSQEMREGVRSSDPARPE
jgi:predicted Rossmann-fold nucleotide-binding protein